jgi:hypothetical protein
MSEHQLSRQQLKRLKKTQQESKSTPPKILPEASAPRNPLPLPSPSTSSQIQPSNTSMSKPGFQTYSLDKYAHDLVFARKDQDNEILNQAHKMRSTVAYGLERFWGEQHRLDRTDTNKAAYWKATWNTLSKILQDAGITLPDDANNLWAFNQEHRKIAIAVLSELCNCMIWWTQRYK